MWNSKKIEALAERIEGGLDEQRSIELKEALYFSGMDEGSALLNLFVKWYNKSSIHRLWDGEYEDCGLLYVMN